MTLADEGSRTETGTHMLTDTGTTSQIFDIPVDLAQPADLLERITGWVGDGQRRAPRHVRQRPRAQPVAGVARRCTRR